MSRLRIIFAGSGEFGLPTLRRLLEQRRHEIVQVISQPDRPAGRGLRLTPTAIAQFATEQHLPLVRTGNINELDLPDAHLMLVIAFGQKIAPHIVDHPRLGSINLHASRLPRHRGAAPVNWAIIRGDTVTGNSVIRLVQRMDAGPILAQSQVTIEPLETAGELHDRLAQDGVELIERLLDNMARTQIIAVPQDESLATLAPKLRREDARIDWQRPANEIAGQIRGMHPWPGCRVVLMDGTEQIARLTLVRARAGAADGTGASPGEILDSHRVMSGDGAVEILELQPEGKRPMSLEAFRNGHRWEMPMRLESFL